MHNHCCLHVARSCRLFWSLSFIVEILSISVLLDNALIFINEKFKTAMSCGAGPLHSSFSAILIYLLLWNSCFQFLCLFCAACWIFQVTYQILAEGSGRQIREESWKPDYPRYYSSLNPQFTVKCYKLFTETLISTNPGLLPRLRRGSYLAVCSGRTEVLITL